jgi:DNA-nicking Smr family endonuclease
MWCWSTTIPRRSGDVSGLRRKPLTEQDRQDWAAYARLVAPLHSSDVPADLPPPAEPLLRPASPPVPRPAAVAPPSLAVGAQPGGLDNATWNRFRGGRLVPARTLDLHGRTAQRAFHALHAFLHAAQADGVRCVEVITGRGSGETGGVLRRELPMWLNLPALRPLVLAASHPHAANPGAVRVLLRRTRA